METALLNVMREVSNFFSKSFEEGNFIIENGIITVNSKYLINSYIAITGSILSSGIYKVTDDKITLSEAEDEQFYGAVYQLAVPKDFVALSEEIKAWIAQNPPSNLTSYRFGITSGSYAVNKDGIQVTWVDVFADRLGTYRTRMFKDVPL